MAAGNLVEIYFNFLKFRGEASTQINLTLFNFFPKTPNVTPIELPNSITVSVSTNLFENLISADSQIPKNIKAASL